MNKADAEKKMQAGMVHFKDELRAVRTGRAQPSLVEDLPVEAYGSMQPLKAIASISIPEPRLIQIQPWDKSLSKAIEKAVQQSDLGLTPTVTGEVIRLALPELTAERREELTKVVNTKAETARIALRNIREEFLKSVKQEVSDGTKSEDEMERAKKEAQQLMDNYNSEIATVVEAKNEQIKTV